MNKKCLLLLVVALPLFLSQGATAGVFMCKDPATGRTIFTDKGCDSYATREEVRVDPTNVDSGARTATKAEPKTWKSDHDSRQTGRDINQEYKARAQNRIAGS